MTNIFSILGIIVALNCLVLSLIILRSKSSRLRNIWLINNISIAVWGLGCYLVGISSNQNQALISWKIAHIGGLMISIFFYHLVYILCDLKKKTILILAYLQVIVVQFLNIATPLFLSKIKIVYGIYYPQLSGPVYPIAFSAWLCFAFLGNYELIKFYRKQSGNKRAQSLYLLIGYVIGFMGGCIVLMPIYDIKIAYPIGNVTIILYTIMVTYAIFRHHLMDVEVVIKKTLVFAGLSAFVLSCITATSFLIQDILGKTIGMPKILSYILTAVVLIALYEPVKKLLVNITDKYLFQKKYSYRQIIKPFIDDVATELDLDKIVSRTIDLLEKTFHPLYSDILLLNRGKYISYGVKDESAARIIEKASPITEHVRSIKDILSIEDENDKKISEEIKNEMLSLKASLAVPLLIRDELIGIILLGKKKSDEYYAKEELVALMDLARTEAIAIKNAQLTKEIAERSEQRGVDKTSIGAAHQMKNILAEIKVDTEAMYFEVGYRYPNPDSMTIEQAKSFVAFTKEKLAKILRQTDKGTGALDAILYPAKAKDDFDLVNISSLIKQAITSSSQIKSKDVLEKNVPAPLVMANVPDNFPQIVGNEKLLEQILQNLINNAFDAILTRYIRLKPDNSYRGKITVTAKDKKGSIIISVEDNGIGMEDEVKEKLFGGFFTTKSVQKKGHGAGLYTMQDWIKQHNGNISFTSEFGKGTAFTLELPKKQEDYNGPKNANT